MSVYRILASVAAARVWKGEWRGFVQSREARLLSGVCMAMLGMSVTLINNSHGISKYLHTARLSGPIDGLARLLYATEPKFYIQAICFLPTTIDFADSHASCHPVPEKVVRLSHLPRFGQDLPSYPITNPSSNPFQYSKLDM